MGRIAALALTVGLLAASVPTRAASQAPYRAAEGNIRFALVGDAIISRPLSAYREPEYLRMVEAIRAADVAFANLEISLQEVADLMPMPTSGGSYMFAHPDMAEELAWAGFDVVSRANNHTFDYGVEGMRATTRAVDAAGLAQAGVGENLALAEEAGYVETADGRVGLISTASTFEDFQAAGPQLRDLRGNPGLNPLRYEQFSELPRPSFDALRGIAEALGQGPRGADTLRFFGETFTVGEQAAVRTRLARADAERLSRSIAAAKRQADWLIVTTHTHEGAGDREIPAEFLVEYAHLAIDAGADVFVGHGPHVLRGIEIYKGKPIFYSLGNFLFENETVQFRPGAEVVRAAIRGGEYTVDYYDARQRESPNGYFTKDPVYWESVVAMPVFAGGKLEEIRLLPITLGYGESRARRGRPVAADAAMSRKIIDRLAKLSAPFGTQIRFENGVGVIRP